MLNSQQSFLYPIPLFIFLAATRMEIFAFTFQKFNCKTSLAKKKSVCASKEKIYTAQKGESSQNIYLEHV